jgi:hypothetical protein
MSTPLLKETHMTLQERELLERFLQQMAAVRVSQKDPEAEALIREAVVRQPDAAYLLVQRAIQLEQALQGTQAQVQKLQAELDQSRPVGGGGFLNDPTWGAQPNASAGQNSAPMRQAAGAPMAAGPTAAGPTAWGGSGMLGNIATTAAGVVAGSFLFQGIDRLMHHGDTSWGSAQDRSALSDAPDNTTVNNYYNDIPADDDTSADTIAESGDSSDFA